MIAHVEGIGRFNRNLSSVAETPREPASRRQLLNMCRICGRHEGRAFKSSVRKGDLPHGLPRADNLFDWRRFENQTQNQKNQTRVRERQ